MGRDAEVDTLKFWVMHFVFCVSGVINTCCSTWLAAHGLDSAESARSCLGEPLASATRDKISCSSSSSKSQSLTCWHEAFSRANAM